MADYRERFLIVAFTWRGPAKVDEITPLFDKALDWLKLGASTWILWTNTDPSEWFTYIQPFLGENDTVFVGELDLSTTFAKYAGWQKKFVWGWIDKHRS
jgi:hypothetical protein